MINQSYLITMSKKILVADDDHGILEAIQYMLESEGYQVSTTDNGSEVLKLTDDFPNLILLDVWMSGQDGRQVCSKLKHQAKTRNIPIIMISANNETSQTVFEAGADDFLAKPFEIDDLLLKVDQHLQKSH